MLKPEKSLSKPERKRLESSEYVKFQQSIFNRDGWRCRNPACETSRSLTIHHIRKRSQLGGDDPGNCLTLCTECHDLVESSLLRIEVVDVLVKFSPKAD
jgi:5-methylcytosine-specific restriction endonuclease McrA